MPDKPAIFISYRRRDAGGHGRALHDYLSGRFGEDRVFFDRSTIESGDVFPDTLRLGVEGCAALLALIGPEWLDVRGDDGGRRVDDADDFVRREIALALEQGKKVIPVLFDDAPVPPRDRLPDPLKALASCDALTLRGKTYEYQTQRRELVRLLAKVPGVPQPLPETKEAVQADSNRYRMLAEVRRVWIDGYFKDSLHNLVRIELGLKETPNAVSRPWDLIVQRPHQKPRPLPPGQAMGAVFDELGQALLILGAPGAGKTTLLLELARDLLDRAVQDATHPIPVVFHLSSWAVRRRPLVDWLVDELTERYYVPRKLAQAWTDAEQVLPLLDGLDEVAPENRTACVEAINTFRRGHALVPLAVCSRATDYEVLPVRVEFSGAVVIEPLSRVQVRSYLKQTGRSLAGVRTVLQDDETLWELLKTPLMLSIVALAYQGRSAKEVRATGSLEQRRTHLFENYTRKMFERRTKITVYTQEQTLRWLSWLACALMRNKLSIFYVEWMQPDWLSARAQRWIVAIVPIMISGLVLGTAYWLVFKLVLEAAHWLVFGLAAGLFGGVVVGLSSRLDRITPAEAVRWSWRKARDYGIVGLVFGLAAGLFGGVVVGLFGPGGGPFGGVVLGLVFGLAAGLFGGVVVGLFGGVTTHQIVTRTIPNEGIQRSLRNALMSLLTVGLAAGLFGGLAAGLLVWLGGSEREFDIWDRLLLVWLLVWLISGVVVGLFGLLAAGLQRGGFAYLKHYVLRTLLLRNDHGPWNYIRFLDYAAERVFLRKVGGGYIFTHRLLMEYFATLQPTGEVPVRSDISNVGYGK